MNARDRLLLSMNVEPAPGARRRKAILILGMHRSGTSAMAGLIAQIGAGLPLDLMAASPSNELGHFEPVAVANYNDQILAALGISWNTLFPPDPGVDRASVLAGYRAHAREIIRYQYSGGLIVMKEPRLSLLLDLWIEALQAEGYQCVCIVMVRNPHEVAASLNLVHGIVPVHGLLTWATYMASADLATRGLPRLFCNYQTLLNDPAGTLAAIVRAFDLGADLPGGHVPDDATNIVRSGLRHHAVEPTFMPPSLAPLESLADHCRALAAGLFSAGDASTAALLWLETLRPVVLPLLDETRRDAYRRAGIA